MVMSLPDVLTGKRPIYSPTISNPLCFTYNLGFYLGKDESHLLVLLSPRKGELGRWIQCYRKSLFYLEGSTIIAFQRQKTTAFVFTMFVSAAYWEFRWDAENSHIVLLCKEGRLCILLIRFFLSTAVSQGCRFCHFRKCEHDSLRSCHRAQGFKGLYLFLVLLTKCLNPPPPNVFWY